MKRAFTLIELLVVIAIIAILAAILFPVFTQAKASAQASACTSNARQLFLGTQLYLDSNDDQFPPAAYSVSATEFRIWHDIIDPYIKNKDVWLCPGSPLKRTDANGTPTSHFGYNARYLTDFAFDFSNANSQTTFGVSALAEPTDTLVYVAAISSVQNSFCGDEGKFLLPPSAANADCWGRPIELAGKSVTLAWADGHASRRPLGRFYTGQTPADKFFDRD